MFLKFKIYNLKLSNRGDLKIIYGSSLSSINIPNVNHSGSRSPSAIVDNLDKIINSDLSNNEKKVKMKEIVDSPLGEDTLDEILKNWNSGL